MVATRIIESLILDLVEWAGRKKRTYQATMDAWRTSYPRFPVWESATGRGLVETASANGRRLVRVTPASLALLREKRPHSYEQLQRQMNGEREAFSPARVSVAAVADRGCSGGLLVRRSSTKANDRRLMEGMRSVASQSAMWLVGRRRALRFAWPQGCAAIFGCKG